MDSQRRNLAAASIIIAASCGLTGRSAADGLGPSAGQAQSGCDKFGGQREWTFIVLAQGDGDGPNRNVAAWQNRVHDRIRLFARGRFDVCKPSTPFQPDVAQYFLKVDEQAKLAGDTVITQRRPWQPLQRPDFTSLKRSDFASLQSAFNNGLLDSASLQPALNNGLLELTIGVSGRVQVSGGEAILPNMWQQPFFLRTQVPAHGSFFYGKDEVESTLMHTPGWPVIWKVSWAAFPSRCDRLFEPELTYNGHGGTLAEADTSTPSTSQTTFTSQLMNRTGPHSDEAFPAGLPPPLPVPVLSPEVPAPPFAPPPIEEPVRPPEPTIGPEEIKAFDTGGSFLETLEELGTELSLEQLLGTALDGAAALGFLLYPSSTASSEFDERFPIREPEAAPPTVGEPSFQNSPLAEPDKSPPIKDPHNFDSRPILDPVPEPGAQYCANPQNKLPDNESQLSHIFRDTEGHLPDNPENRALLIDVANDKTAILGSDRFGNIWSARTLPNGTQVWTSSQGGTIQNGGINQVSRAYDPTTGLSRNSIIGK